MLVRRIVITRNEAGICFNEIPVNTVKAKKVSLYGRLLNILTIKH